VLVIEDADDGAEVRVDWGLGCVGEEAEEDGWRCRGGTIWQR